MKIIYHDDPDGWCAAAVAYRALASSKPIAIRMNHGKEMPWKHIEKDEDVYMLDFSLPMPDMERLNEISNLIWIDHHISSITDCEEYGLSIKGHRKIGEAGCELTWKWFYSTRKMPDAVRWIGRYDVWDHKNEPCARPFQYGIKIHEHSKNPESDFWVDVIHDHEFAMRVLEDGGNIQKYQNNLNKSICERGAFETEFEGHKCIACVSPYANSMLFDSVWDDKKYAMMLSFYWSNNGHWVVSFYTERDDIDCSIYAKKYGGGGHKGAAGIQCKELPFKLCGGK